jgi:hypothetical protein
MELIAPQIAARAKGQLQKPSSPASLEQKLSFGEGENRFFRKEAGSARKKRQRNNEKDGNWPNKG